ncbi:MAG: hypothetical protein HGA36_03990 [Candidatus Moranbacteria bacterium]|nr:hypothetical protein [Candidatus Moranbacteria bacterium]
MIKKNLEKLAAIALRKQGFSYNEILQKIPVAKSTLSVWLRDIGIAKKQTQRLTEKRKVAQQKAHQTCRNNRIEKERNIISQARSEVKKISQKELWLIGIALYWAEGSKQKETNVSQGVSFGNSDPQMILLFHKWMQECCNVSKERFDYRIYIHNTADIEKAKKFWSKLLDEKIEKVHLKNHNPKTIWKNSHNDYNGLLRIDITRSTDLNRRIKGWVLGIVNNLK